MELSKKTTILLSPELHRRLSRIAAREGVSLGALVREACVEHYGLASTASRTEAVAALAALRLPVASTRRMKQESQPDPHERLP